MGTQIFMNSINIINSIMITNALMKVDHVLNIAWSMLVHFIFCLLEGLSKSDGKIRGLCRRGFRQSRAIYALAMSKDSQTSQEISLSNKGICFYEQPPRMDSGQSGICHRTCTSRRAASGQQSESISSARMNLKWKSSLKYKPKDILSVVCK